MEEVASKINTCLSVDFKKQRIYSGLSGWVQKWSQRLLFVNEGERKGDQGQREATGRRCSGHCCLWGKGGAGSRGIWWLLKSGKDKRLVLSLPLSLQKALPPLNFSLGKLWASELLRASIAAPWSCNIGGNLLTAATEISYRIWAAFITVWNLS